MSFLSQRSSSELVGAGIIAILVGLAVRVYLAGGIGEYFSANTRLESEIVAALEQRPADLAVLRSVEQYFPLEYDDLLEQMAASVKAGGTPGEAGSAQLLRFLDRHKSDFAFASVASLDEVLAKETATVEALAEQDPAACAGFARDPQDPFAGVDAATQTLIGETFAARVRAMAAGRAEQHMRLEITPSDLAKLADHMRGAGAQEEQLSLIFDGEGLNELSVDAQCDAIGRMLRAIAAEADEEQRALLIGKILAVRLAD